MIDVDQICRNVQEEINKRSSASIISFTFSDCEGCKERDKEISELKAKLKESRLKVIALAVDREDTKLIHEIEEVFKERELEVSEKQWKEKRGVNK